MTSNKEIQDKIHLLWSLMEQCRELNAQIFEALTEEDLEATWHSVSTRIRAKTDNSHAESVTSAETGELVNGRLD